MRWSALALRLRVREMELTTGPVLRGIVTEVAILLVIVNSALEEVLVTDLLLTTMRP